MTVGIYINLKFYKMKNQNRTIFKEKFGKDVEQIINILKGRGFKTSEILLEAQKSPRRSTIYESLQFSFQQIL